MFEYMCCYSILDVLRGSPNNKSTFTAIDRVYHSYGSHCGIFVTVVMVTVTVSNYATPRQTVKP